MNKIQMLHFLLSICSIRSFGPYVAQGFILFITAVQSSLNVVMTGLQRITQIHGLYMSMRG